MLDGVGQVDNSESRSHDKDSHWSIVRRKIEDMFLEQNV